MSFIVLVRGGGDLASGIVLRLHRAGLRVAISELPEPLAVRRLVSFSEAVYSGEWQVEEVSARRVTDITDTLRILRVFSQHQVPVLIDPQAQALGTLRPTVLIDARMAKQPPELDRTAASLVIGLGPGFTAGENCHVVVETNRGHCLGRVITSGSAEADTGEPEVVLDRGAERVLRAPAAGTLSAHVEICDRVETGQLIADVSGQPITAPFAGAVRGLLRSGTEVGAGLKIGDVDPRGDPAFCRLVSDKSLSVGGGVLEAILARPDLRPLLWT